MTTRKRSWGVISARRTQRRSPTALPSAAYLSLQPVTGCELTNEHTNEHTNKHDGSQYLLAVVNIAHTYSVCYRKSP